MYFAIRNVYIYHSLTQRIWIILNKNTHICERCLARLKLMKGKIAKISSSTLSFFTIIKKNRYSILRRIIMGNVDIFSPFRSHSKYLAQFVNIISLAMETFLFFTVYWNLLEGMFQRGNLGIFFILLNEHRLNQGVFIDIEQFKKCVA